MARVGELRLKRLTTLVEEAPRVGLAARLTIAPQVSEGTFVPMVVSVKSLPQTVELPAVPPVELTQEIRTLPRVLMSCRGTMAELLPGTVALAVPVFVKMLTNSEALMKACAKPAAAVVVQAPTPETQPVETPVTCAALLPASAPMRTWVEAPEPGLTSDEKCPRA